MSYLLGETPASAYETWKRDWTPPEVKPSALRGKVIVEFGPFASEGAIFHANEEESCQAKVIHDSTNEIGLGCDVVVSRKSGTYCTVGGRKFCTLPKDAILLVELSADTEEVV